jgi:hypothetical protein
MNDLYNRGYLGCGDSILNNPYENNPYTVKGVDYGYDDKSVISIDGKTLKEIIEEGVKEFLKEEKTETPKIEKYHMKHK